MNQSVSNVASTTSHARPTNPLEYLMRGVVMEWEKKSAAKLTTSAVTVWNKVEYALTRDGLLYRMRVVSAQILSFFLKNFSKIFEEKK